jgi:surface carbohydrate biosynthesis protein (TIGR04326 family)
MMLDPSHGAADLAGRGLLLWARETDPPPEHGNILLWQGAAREAGVRSLTRYLEDRAEEIRRRYLAWAHELGETAVLGHRLRDRFKLADGTSYWWLSAFVEQSAWKQRSVEIVLKMLALEHLIEREVPTELCVHGLDGGVSRVLRALCRQRGIRYREATAPRATPGLRALSQRLPRTLQGLFGLAYFACVRLALRRPSSAAACARRVLICGPFANHNAARQQRGAFASRYWGTLPEALVQEGFEVQWLHYFYAHEEIPTARAAREILRRLGEASTQAPRHALVESYLSVGDYAAIFIEWLALTLESWMVGWCLRRRFARNPHESYWPVIRDDWAKTFRGFGCVQNLLFDRCFDRALQSSGAYSQCLYLMENQGWERALAKAWHRHQHGRLTGVAHSTVRFWDLRYHCDPRRYDEPHRALLPGPDWVVLNGRAARGEYLDTCAEREFIAVCEALRYLHLRPGSARDLGDLTQLGRLKILILGDYTRDRTDSLLRAALAVRDRTSLPLELWIKPHPGCPAAPLPDAALKIANDPVAALVSSAHVVLASNTTSAALEAYVCGARVFVFDDLSGVNYSPLRRVRGVSFVHDADDLCRAIDSLGASAPEEQRHTEGFFNVDPDLPGWRLHLANQA